MSRAQISVLVAISTFSIGIFAVLIGFLFTPLRLSEPIVLSSPTKESVALPATTPMPPAPSVQVLTEEIEIKFEGIKETPITDSKQLEKIFQTLRFKLTNRLKEQIYYSGYSNEDNCDYAVYKDGNKLYQPNCWCMTGLEEREIWQKYSQTLKFSQVLDLSIPKNLEGKIQIEFDFKIGEKRRKKSVRIDVELPIKQTAAE
jgi:hypothetical protein